MSFFHPDLKAVRLKLVYVGPPGSGKSSILALLRQRQRGYEAPAALQQAFREIETSHPVVSDASVRAACDHVEFEAPLRDHVVRAVLLALPRWPEDDLRRRVLLDAADAVFFVADSSPSCLEANRRWMDHLRADLSSLTATTKGAQIVVHYHKRDQPGVVPVAQLADALNAAALPGIESSCVTGQGVFDGLRIALKTALG